MVRKIQQMRSSKYTKELLKKSIKNWKNSISNGEFQTVLHAKRNDNLHKLYNIKKDHSWIYKTIEDKKLRKNLQTCNNIVLVGCGLYPYSLFDMHKRFPKIKYHGVEISDKRVKLAKIILEETPAKDDIIIYCSAGEEFDYSMFDEDDMIFISCDVISGNITKRIYETSKAQVFPCAPYKSSYVNGIFT